MSSEPFNPFTPFTSNEANMSIGDSSQMEGDPVEHRNVTEGQTAKVMLKKESRTKNFTEKEDIMLCSAWGNVGMDPVVGSNQSTATYWQRIYDYYHEHKDFPSDRNQRSLTARWQSIREHVTKYSGCLAQVERRNQSGTNLEDKVCFQPSYYYTIQFFNFTNINYHLFAQRAEAGMLYHSNEKKKFMYMHCYIALHHHPKWKSSFSSKKQKASPSGSPGSSPSGGIYVDLEGDTGDGSGKAPARPMGMKAAKSLRRHSMSSDCESAMKASTDSINSQIMENEQKRQEMLHQHQNVHEKGLQDRHEQHLAAKHKKIEMLRQMEEKKMEQKERLKLIEIEAEDRRRRNEKNMELEARELDMIMQLDHSKLNDESKEYYEKRKKKLLAKKDLRD